MEVVVTDMFGDFFDFFDLECFAEGAGAGAGALSYGDGKGSDH